MVHMLVLLGMQRNDSGVVGGQFSVSDVIDLFQVGSRIVA